MNNVKVVLYHLPDNKYRIALRDSTDHEFNLEAFNSTFLDIREKLRANYNFAYQLAGFLEVDFIEIQWNLKE